MMSTSWNDGYVKCPFYIRDDGCRCLTCQGVADSSKLLWRFQTKQDFKIQMDTFCCGKFSFCEVYRMLSAIYEEDSQW